jgi:hypothetical protein
MQWRRFFEEGSEVPYRMVDWRKTRTQATVGADYIYSNRAFIGTPKQYAAKIKGLQAQGIEYFGCNFAMGGIPQDKVLRSMALFAKEVMTHFQDYWNNIQNRKNKATCTGAMWCWRTVITVRIGPWRVSIKGGSPM